MRERNSCGSATLVAWNKHMTGQFEFGARGSTKTKFSDASAKIAVFDAGVGSDTPHIQAGRDFRGTVALCFFE